VRWRYLWAKLCGREFNSLDLGADDKARRNRRGGDKVGRVFAGNRKPGKTAGELARGHDQNRHQELIGAVAVV